MIAEETKETRVVQVLGKLDGALLAASIGFRETNLEIDPNQIAAVCSLLKSELQFNRLSSITAADWHPIEPRFHLAYHLHSVDRKERLRLKCKLDSARAEIDSVIHVWRSADWYEREVFDLFGVRFRNHPDMTRILMPDDWNGHPLRKDYPVHGHKYSYADE